MKNFVLLGIVMLVLSGLSVTAANETVTVNMSVQTDGDVFFNADLNASTSYVYVNGKIANPTYVTKKSTNRNGILRTINSMFRVFFGQQEAWHLYKSEVDFLNFLDLFRQSIVSEVYYSQVKQLQLELMAQKEINKKLDAEIRAIKQKLGMQQDKFSLECYGYVKVMTQNPELGIDSITCSKGNETQTWFKQERDVVMVKAVQP